MNWHYIRTKEDLDRINDESSEHPVVIFKHSTRCSISAASLNRLERNWDVSKSGDIKPYFLDLIAFRDLSNEIASRYDVVHQSPQVLLIKDSKCVYSNSHFGINFEELVRHFQLIEG